MILLDTFREIKKTFGRFFSIFAIVAIGVAFFAGIIAAAPDMRFSADHYYDEYNLMDYTIYSTFGLTESDIKAIRAIPEVEGVMPSHSLDVMGRRKDTDYEFVIRIHGLPNNTNSDNKNYINQIQLVEGRMPENENECLMEKEMFFYGLQIGDTIQLSSGNKENLEDHISINEMIVVGLVQSPYYLSFEKGSSTIGRGQVNAYALVFDSVFVSEYYTEAYVTIKDSDGYDSYHQDYFDFLSVSRSKIKKTGNEQSEIRYEEIMEEAKAELAEKQEEYDEGVKKFEDEITKAEKKLEKAKMDLLTGQIKLETNKESVRLQIENGKAQLETLATVIATTEEQYRIALQTYHDQYDNMITLRDSLQQEITTINQNYPDLDAEIVRITAIPEASRTSEEVLKLQEYTDIQAERDQIQVQINAINSLLSTADSAIVRIEQQLDNLRQQYQIESNNLVTMEKLAEEEFKKAQAEIDKGMEEVLNAEITLAIEKKKAELDLEDAAELLRKAELDIENMPEPEWYVLDRNSHYSYREYGAAADRIRAIGEVFPVFFFFVAALVTLTTMTRMVDEQRQNIGTLKALGYSKAKIASKYILYAAISSALGAIVGLLIGLHLFPTIVFNAWNIMYTIPKLYFRWQPSLVFLSAGIAILVTTAAAFFACYKELMETPALLMRPKTPKSGKPILLERVSFIWSRLTFSEKVTMRNIFRYKKRLLMTVAGISGCTALILGGFGIRDSISSVVNTQFEDIYRYDSMINLNDDMSTFEKTELLKDVNEFKGVSQAILIANENVTLYYGEEDIAVTLTVPSDSIDFQDFIILRNMNTGKEYMLSDEGVIISQKLSNAYGIKVGDTIVVINNDNYRKTFSVEEITEHYVGDYIYMSSSLYQKSFGIKPDDNSIYVILREDTIEAEINFSHYITEQEGVRSIAFFTGTAESFADTISSLNIVIVVLIVSAGSLAFVVLYNLNNVNISERIREIATIKVLGFNDKEVAQYVNRESLLLTVLGSIIGLVIGRFLHLFVMNVIELDQIMFPRYVSFLSHLYALIITIIFGLIVNFVMLPKLRKIPMVESLKSIE